MENYHIKTYQALSLRKLKGLIIIMNVKIYLKYALIVIVACMISCKSDGGDSQQSRIEKELEGGIASESEVQISTASIGAMNEGAEAILKYRIQQDNDSYAAIEMDRWFCRFRAVGSKIYPINDGEWLDFYPDLSYEYGNEDGVKGKGQYHYKFGDGVLLTVDNDHTVKPQEYDAKLSGAVMVLVGKPTYKDNHIQMKFEMDNVPQ